MTMIIQIKTFLYFPPVKTNEKNLREGVISFFEDINKFLSTHNVRPEDIFISDSSDYIFVHVFHKVKKK